MVSTKSFDEVSTGSRSNLCAVLAGRLETECGPFRLNSICSYIQYLCISVKTQYALCRFVGDARFGHHDLSFTIDCDRMT